MKSATAIWLAASILASAPGTGVWAADDLRLEITGIRHQSAQNTDGGVNTIYSFQLINDTDRDYCFLYEYHQDWSEDLIAFWAGGDGILPEIKYSDGYSFPASGWPYLPTPEEQHVIRYGVKRYRARTTYSMESGLPNEFYSPDEEQVQIRLKTEGFWCDALDRYGFRVPLRYKDVRQPFSSGLHAQPGQPSLLSQTPDSEYVFIASEPSKPFIVAPYGVCPGKQTHFTDVKISGCENAP